jgi:glutathione S-transferase
VSTSATHDATPILFCDRGCPFAHRVLSLFEHLAVAFDRREVPLGDKPEGLARYSSSGGVPLLVHGDLVLTESRVMLDYLAERYAFVDAYPSDLDTRTRQRHAMAVADNYLAPRLSGVRVGPDARLPDVLTALQAATTSRPRPSLLSMHLAPIWRAFRQWRPDGEITRAIQARPALRRWLDEASELGCVVRAAADPATLAEDVKRARRAGLLPDLPNLPNTL